MKPLVLAPKTDAQCEEEIDNIISGKNKSRNAWIVRRFISMHKKLGEPDSFIRQMLINEYKIKYGLLQTGKITPEELLKKSQEEIKQVEPQSEPQSQILDKQL
jgi:hypothetical protein